MPLILPSGRRPYLPAAPIYDGATRDWLLDSSGSYRGLHPVDLGMAMSFCQRKGDCKSAPQVGHELHLIPFLDAPGIDAVVQDKVYDAYPCSQYIANGRVKINSIQRETRNESNGLAVVVNYTNLETGERQNATYQT